MARKKKKTKKKKQSCDRHSKTLEWPPAPQPHHNLSLQLRYHRRRRHGFPSSILCPPFRPNNHRHRAFPAVANSAFLPSSNLHQATTTADPGGPSTAPSASAASTSTQPLLPIMEDFLFQVIPSIFLFFQTIMTSLEVLTGVKKWDPEKLKQLCPMESVLETLWELAEKKEGAEKELKAGSDALANMEGLKEGVEEVAKLLAQKRKGAESRVIRAVVPSERVATRTAAAVAVMAKEVEFAFER